jgi:hypothetical protein
MIVPVIQILHLGLLWVLEFFSYPEFFIFPYLVQAGWLPYRQIIDHHTPGLWLLPLNFNSLGFTTPETLKILMLLTILITSVLIFKLSKNKWAVFFYAIWQPLFHGNQLWPDLFLPLFTLPAFYFSLSQNWLLCGLFIGFASVFKQTALVLVILINFLIFFKARKIWQNISLFYLGLLLPWVPILFYFYQHRLLSDFVFWAFTFNLTSYSHLAIIFPTIKEIILIGSLVLPVLFSWFILPQRRPYIKYIILWTGFSLVGIFGRFDLRAFQPALPFICMLWGFLAVKWQKTRPLFFLVLISLPLFIALRFYSHQKNFFSYRFFDSATTNIVNRIKTLTKPGDTLLLLGGQPHLYFLTGTYPPDKYFVFQLPWLLRATSSKLINSWNYAPSKYVVYDSTSGIDGLRFKDYGSDLLKYLRDNYLFQEKIGDYLIYQLNPDENRY